MKKLILLVLVSFMVCISSCKRDPEIITIDFKHAVYNYEYYRDKTKLEYILKIRDSKGQYKPNIDEVSDTLRRLSEEFVSESFDSLYIKYGSDEIRKLVYLREGAVLNSKEELHTYYVNSAVKDIISAMAMQITTEANLNAAEIVEEIPLSVN